MQQIKIAERFHPFTHQPGASVVLPFSTLSFQIYPAFIRVFDLTLSKSTLLAEFPLSVKGPVNGFTVQQDLEKGFLKVWGDSAQGFFRYRIESTTENNWTNKFVLIPEKMPEVLPEAYCGIAPKNDCSGIERLSFGVTKTSDWTLVTRRALLSEILPFWFRLGQMVPSSCAHSSGNAILLDQVQDALNQKDSLTLASLLKNLFLVGFEGVLSPTLIDPLHQGFSFSTNSIDNTHSSLVLLTRGAQLIKKMLISVREDVDGRATVDILPSLIPELHAGRFCDIHLESIGRLDLEWSKKQTRRLIFYSAKEQVLTFNFQKDLKSFRLRSTVTPVASVKSCGESVAFSEGTYFLDNFER